MSNVRPQKPDPQRATKMAIQQPLSKQIERAVAEIEPMAAAGFAPAQSILRQLLWCRAYACGEPGEPMPGPFSMGLIATREFDMYGDNPDLALLINQIQNEVNKKLS